MWQMASQKIIAFGTRIDVRAAAATIVYKPHNTIVRLTKSFGVVRRICGIFRMNKYSMMRKSSVARTMAKMCSILKAVKDEKGYSKPRRRDQSLHAPEKYSRSAGRGSSAKNSCSAAQTSTGSVAFMTDFIVVGSAIPLSDPTLTLGPAFIAINCTK